jgi:hypothetical protein
MQWATNIGGGEGVLVHQCSPYPPLCIILMISGASGSLSSSNQCDGECEMDGEE